LRPVFARKFWSRRCGSSWIIVDHWGREKSDTVFKQLYLRMDFRQWRSNTFRTILSTIWHFNGDSTDCSNNIGDSTKSET
jgi:hypothetical protein